ncbi:protein phosphatase 1 regulatory subunit 14D isoform X2 [Heliangelus exortis]|uniref:protein phosphatase 1 regulatory subunit 14D isoform X2 n=1 Tax=Heliangelus exortis TaxID=472823 RepID=UPI003A910363
MASNSSTLPRVTFQTPEKPGEESSHRKLGKLTIKYNRKDLQRWLDLEEWINNQLQELYQCRLREETEEAAPEPQIDLEDLLEVPNEEQKLKLQEILHECSSPTEVFISPTCVLLHLSSASHFLVELAKLRDGLQSPGWSFTGSARGTACFALDGESSRSGQQFMVATRSRGT